MGSLSYRVPLILIFWEISLLYFHSGSTRLHSPKQYSRFLISSKPCQHLCFLFNNSYSDNMRWYLIMVLIHIFMMSSDVEHFFMYLFGTCVSLEKCWCMPLAYLKSGFKIFCYWLIGVPYIFWRLTLYQIHVLKIFSLIL
jgi:hypothetical protein